MTVEIDLNINFNDLQRTDSHSFHVFNLLSYEYLGEFILKLLKISYITYIIGDKKNDCQNGLSLKFSIYENLRKVIKNEI